MAWKFQVGLQLLKMSTLLVLVLVFTHSSLNAADGHPSLLDKSVVNENEMFTITCDRHRVFVPGGQTCVSKMLVMRRTAGTAAGPVNVVYMLPGNSGGRNFTNRIPKNRAWYVTASYTTDITKINLTVIVTDTVVADEGTYYCRIETCGQDGDAYGVYDNLTVIKAETTERLYTSEILKTRITSITTTELIEAGETPELTSSLPNQGFHNTVCSTSCFSMILVGSLLFETYLLSST